jgi:Uma2 family endonuclease
MPLLVDDYLPAVLTAGPKTDEEFAELCSEHPDLFFEMTAEGELIVMPPTYTLTGYRHRAILVQLDRWAQQDGGGGVSDAAAGFVLPNGARRSPDVAWTLNSRVRQLDPRMIERYWHICPDFIVEVRSQTDRLRTLREKMQEWIANGVQLGWLIDPERRAVEIYRPNREPEIRTNVDSINGDAPIQGFELDLRPVWDPLGERDRS